MNSKILFSAIGEIEDRFIDEAAPKQKEQVIKRRFSKVIAAAAAAIALIIIIPAAASFMKREQPNTPDLSHAPGIVLDGTTYFETGHRIAFETCPNGFEYGGVIESGTAEGCSYYTNSQMPEWIYVRKEATHTGPDDAVDSWYVRYVEKSIRGKKLINYNGTIYVSMFDADDPLVADKTLYDEIENTYGLRIEDSNVNNFQPAGTTIFEGFDVVPYNNCGSNIHQKEEQLYTNPANENVILLSASWETASGRQTGFDVYIRSDYNYSRHEHAEIFKYNGQYFSASDLSAKTVEWLEWYHSLPAAEQSAVRSFDRKGKSGTELYT